MKNFFVVSAVGRDRPGFVHDIAHAVRSAGGNIESQRSARMAAEFAVIMLCSLEAADAEALQKAVNTLNALQQEGLFISARPASGPAEEAAGPASVLEATGADQPGLIDEVTKLLFEQGINIESMDYDVEGAPMSGEPLFRMRAALSLPADLDLDGLRSRLRDLEDAYNFDILLRA